MKWQNGKKAKRWSKKVSDGPRWFEMDKNIKRERQKDKDNRTKTKRQRQKDKNAKDKDKKTKMQKTKRRSEIVGEGFRWSEMV